MTKLIDQALTRARALSPQEQDLLAELLMAQMDGDLAWDEAASKVTARLAALADEAWAAFEAGKGGAARPLRAKVAGARPDVWTQLCEAARRGPARMGRDVW